MLRFRVIKDDILQHIADTINVAYFVVSKDWRKMFFVSKAYEEIYGKSLEELYHNPVAWFEAIHPDDKDIIIQKTS
ncbi:MAG TPA: PAS domain-containing protein, partial [Spirochaetota bacterium]|nr:PAS domain-containing protein [Spirochaetota bacterium]